MSRNGKKKSVWYHIPANTFMNNIMNNTECATLNWQLIVLLFINLFLHFTLCSYSCFIHIICNRVKQSLFIWMAGGWWMVQCSVVAGDKQWKSECPNGVVGRFNSTIVRFPARPFISMASTTDHCIQPRQNATTQRTDSPFGEIIVRCTLYHLLCRLIAHTYVLSYLCS